MADENRGDMLQAACDTICFVCWVLFFGTLFSRMCHMLKLAILQYMRGVRCLLVSCGRGPPLTGFARRSRVAPVRRANGAYSARACTMAVPSVLALLIVALCY